MTSTRSKRIFSKKGPPCTICRHADRARIEASRVAGVSLDNVSSKFGVSRDAVHRHMARHVDEDTRLQYILEIPIKELAARASAEGTSLLDYFSIVRAVLLQQFQLAAACNDKNGTAVLGGRLVEVLREIGRLTGEMLRSPTIQNVHNTVTFVNSPDFLNLQRMLIERLAGHPAALSAVIDGLAELDSRSASRAPTAPLIEHHGGAHVAA